MKPIGRLSAGVLLALTTAVWQVHGQPLPPETIIRDIRIIGAAELSEREVLSAAAVRVGGSLNAGPGPIGQAVEHHYQETGYTFARVKATFDDTTATLTLEIDEGVVDQVEFVGVRGSLARMFADEFAVRGGDVFNRQRAMDALGALLLPTRGAIRPSAGAATSGARYDPGTTPRPTFARIDRNGERVLVVGLAEPPGRVRVSPDLGDREDWFTAVDGFVPSVGFGVALFDHHRFNHAYIAGHLSYKVASQEVGYAVGFEKPFFESTKLFVGAEVFELTASDDRWRLSSTEASLFAIAARREYRDYYDRQGGQVSAAVRPTSKVELLFAWRDERHRPERVQTDFSVWNQDEPFRPNLLAAPGRLHALVLGAVVDSEGFTRESLDASYRRHQLEQPFGDRLSDIDRNSSPKTAWRIDWNSEISSPDHFGGDLDFRRHIVNARGSLAVFPHQEITARAVGGWSDGVLPPQRLFALGGIGTVHGYEFKEAVGDALALGNVEYAIGWRRDLRALVFFDAGRVTGGATGDSPWMRGIGFGFGLAGARIDFGYPLRDGTRSLQVLFRLSRTF
jgi:outer membrane protein assembly factor BamA